MPYFQKLGQTTHHPGPGPIAEDPDLTQTPVPGSEPGPSPFQRCGSIRCSREFLSLNIHSFAFLNSRTAHRKFVFQLTLVVSSF